MGDFEYSPSLDSSFKELDDMIAAMESDNDSELGKDGDPVSDDYIDMVELTQADESALVLSVIQSNSTPEEFEQIVTESAVDMECYGLIKSADAALEATKNIVRLNKFAGLSREEAKAELMLAKRANDPAYKLYKKYRKLMKDQKLKIHQKYGTRAKSEARKIIANSRHKAAAMKTKNGNVIVSKIDAGLKKLDSNLRTGAAIPKNPLKK